MSALQGLPDGDAVNAVARIVIYLGTWNYKEILPKTGKSCSQCISIFCVALASNAAVSLADILTHSALQQGQVPRFITRLVLKTSPSPLGHFKQRESAAIPMMFSAQWLKKAQGCQGKGGIALLDWGDSYLCWLALCTPSSLLVLNFAPHVKHLCFLPKPKKSIVVSTRTSIYVGLYNNFKTEESSDRLLIRQLASVQGSLSR